jgi:exosortase
MKFASRNVLFALFTLIVTVIMSGTLRDLISFALNRENTHASQIVLIPFISAALIYFNRKNIFRSVTWSVARAVPVLILGVGLLLAGRTVGARLEEGDHLALMTSSAVVLWLGGFLLFYGTMAFRTAIFPLLFMGFFIPIPGAILNGTITILQRASAEMAYVILKLSGTPVLKESAYVMRLPDLVIQVAPECSGIRSGISLLISSLLAGHLFLRSMWRRSVLVIVAIPVLIFKNALRIGTLSYLAVHVDQRILTSELHREGGIPFFVLGLLLLYPVLEILIKSENKTRVSGAGATVTLKPVTVSNTDSAHI